VLAIAPGLHAAPPVLPEPTEAALVAAHVSTKGFDFILHVGVANRGPLRVEKKGHKNGYDTPDAKGQYAPITRNNGDGEKPIRGAGNQYHDSPDELHTDISTKQLMEHLHQCGGSSAVHLHMSLYILRNSLCYRRSLHLRMQGIIFATSPISARLQRLESARPATMGRQQRQRGHLCSSYIAAQ
jgi:hypothetical protein